MIDKLKTAYELIRNEISKSKALRIFLLVTAILALLWLLFRPASKPALEPTPQVSVTPSPPVEVDSVTQAAIDRVRQTRP